MNEELKKEAREEVRDKLDNYETYEDWKLSVNNKYISILEEYIDKATLAERKRLTHVIDLILPLAKGYVAENRTGSNQKYIEIAESAINTPDL